MARSEKNLKNRGLAPVRAELAIYEDSRGNIEFRADTKKETIWSTQAQIADVFDIERSVVTKHVRNILRDKELDRGSVCAKFAHTATDGKVYQVEFYNLDIILAVGYRTNSRKAIKFRQWATKTLREYVLKGYVLNAKRLKESSLSSAKELRSAANLIQSVLQKRALNQSEIDGLLSVIKGYTNTFITLHKYDEGVLSLKKTPARERKTFTHEFVRPAINELKSVLIGKSEASEIFGQERDESFRGILGNVYQTFGGKELYKSREEKSAHLLYFIIKDHPFVDGNKRIGSFLFVYFLELNGLLYRKNGEKKINDNALTALAILIAESDPKEKQTMIKLVTNLIA